MAGYKNTYGLPDATLQLIGAGPELNFGAAPQGGMTSIINALRGERSSNNPGVRLLANRGNSEGINFNRAPSAASNRFPILKMPKATRPEVTLPGAEPVPTNPRGPGVFPPDVVLWPDPVDPDPIDPDPVDPDPEDPDPEDPDPVDPDPVDPDPVDPDPVDPDPVDPDPVDPDPVDPDPVDPDSVDPEIDPSELDPFFLDPLWYPEDPVKERNGTVTIEPVDPNEDSPQDDGTTQDILDLINSGYLDSLLGGGGSGGGKYFDDQSAATMAF